MLVAAPAPEQERLITGEELLAMGDIGPCELIDGRIVYMSPTGSPHGDIEANIARELGNFVKQYRLGRVKSGEVGVYVRRNPDRVRGADVLFISHERQARARPQGYLDVGPELVVEILSPDDTMSGMMSKLRDYFQVGVHVVWVVDPDDESLYVYRDLDDVSHYGKDDTLTLDDVLPGFSTPVAEFFAI